MDLVLDSNKMERGKLYKVVQITIDGEPLICFADEQNGRICHFMILEEILKTRNIPYNEIKVRYGTAPDTRGDRYFVSGMGGAKILTEQRVLFFGNSMDYGLGISEGHLEKFAEKNHDFRWKLS